MYKDMTKEELQQEKAKVTEAYEKFKAMGLKLDMSEASLRRYSLT